jgi:hypothetical protein
LRADEGSLFDFHFLPGPISNDDCTERVTLLDTSS